MSRILPIAGGLGAALAAWFAYRWWNADDGEPAAPVPLPPPPPDGKAGIPNTEREREALARGIASEAGSGTPAEQRGVGWTIRNRFRGKSIYSALYPWRAQKGANPPFSSARPASDHHRKLAEEILLADQSGDPTGGATSFFEPRMQDAFAKAGALARAGETGDRVIDGIKLSDIARFKTYHKNAGEIRDKWSKGSTLYATAGRFEFWGSAPLFAKRGGTVRTIAGADADGFSPDDEEAVSRLVASLGLSDCAAEQGAAWAVRNAAAQQGLTIHALVAPGGEYGPQDHDRLFPTDAEETPRSHAIARAVLGQPASADPTGGAVDFWFPERQRLCHLLEQAGAPGYAGYEASEVDIRRDYARRGIRVLGCVGDMELLG